MKNIDVYQMIIKHVNLLLAYSAEKNKVLEAPMLEDHSDKITTEELDGKVRMAMVSHLNLYQAIVKTIGKHANGILSRRLAACCLNIYNIVNDFKKFHGYKVANKVRFHADNSLQLEFPAKDNRHAQVDFLLKSIDPIMRSAGLDIQKIKGDINKAQIEIAQASKAVREVNAMDFSV